ncbi:hypothetical protein GARC_1533 [Paraglaciecola arctica BSs20135]|uniref:Uncharacterized protein n=1 Tax=Paraglaciecola arctica BSs20135 TaxID=493475 RepID=K6Y3G4_9ALTE|nr:hypothetical protein GARC_1533 [Paraglaciecola arctica BSs20135]
MQILLKITTRALQLLYQPKFHCPSVLVMGRSEDHVVAD